MGVGNADGSKQLQQQEQKNSPLPCARVASVQYSKMFLLCSAGDNVQYKGPAVTHSASIVCRLNNDLEVTVLRHSKIHQLSV